MEPEIFLRPFCCTSLSNRIYFSHGGQVRRSRGYIIVNLPAFCGLCEVHYMVKLRWSCTCAPGAQYGPSGRSISITRLPRASTCALVHTCLLPALALCDSTLVLPQPHPIVEHLRTPDRRFNSARHPSPWISRASVSTVPRAPSRNSREDLEILFPRRPLDSSTSYRAKR